MTFLEIASISKSFGPVNVLKDVNLSIKEGEFVVFVGPSGCGKSTLLRMITGLETPTSGEIKIDGEVMNEVEPADRGTAMVFQSYALYPHMSVFGNISFGLRMAHRAKAFIRQRVESAASILRLESLMERKPGQLSGGQKQRVAIGRAIVREPKVFLFDEPLSNLDAELRVQMRTELIDLHKRLKTTMIYVTHDQVEAMTLADKMVVMNGGHIQQAGHPLTLYDDPDNRFVAGFVGSPRINFLPVSVKAVGGDTIGLSLEGSDRLTKLAFDGLDTDSDEMELGLRPQHLRILKDDEQALEQELLLEGDVVFVEQLGDVTYVHVDVSETSRIIVRADRKTYSGQSRIRAAADLSYAMLFGPDGARLRSRSLPTQ
ncbi:ABC transporter ATP-binding protein [Pelagibacterium xiamenense]|uniref:ABC transporter ATP-binding protein n=1 Tax=Pelagibacterium xiamenense TaxID=2901140 RepID=UPI001E55BD2B|nr:sn-glycerol-3-phosphate ABC transporter ATP-binding protein UgpC [Pelagibacterium xiamenense]MCD7060652.1 sn-glycerol-3-phosphate ABC transporter ATP-binding protein UgpC [Pelagibacterium xiamenense]